MNVQYRQDSKPSKPRSLKPIVLMLGLLAVVFSFVLMTPHYLRAKNEARKRQVVMQYAATMQNAPQWQALAAAFNLHKTTAAAIFHGADRVQCFPVNRTNKQLTDHGGKLSFSNQAPDQSPAFASRLGSIVLSPKTYETPGRTTDQCTIHPGAVFRVWNGPKYVDVILCFHCNQLAVFENDLKVPMTEIGGWLDGRCYVTGNFDIMRPQLVALTKEAFPDDISIQRL